MIDQRTDTSQRSSLASMPLYRYIYTVSVKNYPTLTSDILNTLNTPFPGLLPLHACQIDPVFANPEPCPLGLSSKQQLRMLSAFSEASANIRMLGLPSLAGWPSGDTSPRADLPRYFRIISSAAAREAYLSLRMWTSLSTSAMRHKLSNKGSSLFPIPLSPSRRNSFFTGPPVDPTFKSISFRSGRFVQDF